MLNIVAVRIYFKDGTATPMADLITIDGEFNTIQWNDVEQRKQFEDRIDAYTLFYDERSKMPWDDWINRKERGI